jgi:hypothetical protein
VQVTTENYILFNSQTGNITPIKQENIHSLNEIFDGFEGLEFSPLTFHELILHNISTDFLGQHVSELSRLDQYKSHGDIIKESSAMALGGEEGGIKQIGKNIILKYLDLIKNTWIVVCCVLVTLHTAGKLLEWSTIGWVEILWYITRKIINIIIFACGVPIWAIRKMNQARIERINNRYATRIEAVQLRTGGSIIRRPISLLANTSGEGETSRVDLGFPDQSAKRVTYAAGSVAI